MDLITTAGGTTSNSYATYEEGDEIARTFRTLPGMGVDTLGWFTCASPQEETRKQAMALAAKRIDAAPWTGEKVVWNQAMAGPRVGCNEPANDLLIVDAYKQAQVAEACALLMPISSAARDARDGVASRSIGSRSTTYDTSATRAAASQSASPVAVRILQDAGLVEGNSGSVYLGGR